MSVFIDTSAMLPLLNAKDVDHAAAGEEWTSLIDGGETVVTTNYVLVEAFALVQNRLGMEAARDLYENICPMLHVEWVDPELHEAGMTALLVADRRQLSLTDCVSFQVMRRLGISRAFAFDAHFAEQGFESIPSSAG